MEVDWISLDVGEARLGELESLLSPDERERATRFRFNRDRNRFIACRGRLRELLDVRSDVRFVYTAHGKPRVEDSEMRFNVSHSHGMGMIAITRGREVGCDIEWIDPSFIDKNIPERFFSPYEVAALRALPVNHQRDAFFRCWTRKEAYIKARGMGMSLALDSFDVTLARGEPPALLRGADGWSLHEVDAPPGYAAAIVLEDQPGITMPTSSLISSITKSGGAAAKVSG
jgi:4'-phosphopantetheinyl transferase